MLEIFGLYSGFALFQFFFTYFYSSIVIFQIISHVLQIDKEEALKIFIYSLGCGPITIAALLAVLLWQFPYHTNVFYICSIEVLFVLCSFAFFRQFKLLYHVFQQIIIKVSAKESYNPLTFSINVLVLFCFILILVQVALMPYSIDGDAIEYASVARLIYENKTIGLYPIVNTNGHGGIIASWTHPPLYITNLVWGYLIQGFDKEPGIIKYITPMYCFYTLLLLWHFLSKKNRLTGSFGMLLLITTPIYYQEIILHSIDAMRLYTLLLVFIFLYDLLSKKTYQYVIVAGYLLGMCLLSHSGGIIAVPLICFVYLLLSQDNFKYRLIKIGVIFTIGFMFVLPSYIVNIHKYGAIIEDSTPVWQVRQMDFDSTVNILRGINTPGQQWLYGVLAGLSKTDLFGVSYWILLGGLLFLAIKNINFNLITYFSKDRTVSEEILNRIWTIPLLVIFLFYGMCILTVFLGMNIIIKNMRYLMTLQPFVVIVDAVFLTFLYEKVSKKFLPIPVENMKNN